MVVLEKMQSVADSPASVPTLGNFGTVLKNNQAVAKPPALRGFEGIKRQLHSKLVSQLNFEEVQKLNERERRVEVRAVLEQLVMADGALLGQVDRERMIQDLLNDTLGLGPLEELLRDPTISDILVNSAHEVYVERKGILYETDVQFKDDSHLMQVIDRIVSPIGRRVDETSPMVDARLADGSRVNAIVPPLALRGPCLCIRRFGVNPLKLNDLLANKAFSSEMALLMEAAVKARLNIIISGGTGSGKTTLLNTLSNFIGHGERILTIEDAAELQIQHKHVVKLEGRPPNVEGRGQVTIRDLVRNALRMRPDSIVVGECRGAEALDMLQAMNTGHDGSLTTIHANTPRDTLARLETMIMMSGFDLPVKAMRQQISSAVNMIIQTNRLQGGVRVVTNVSDIVGMEGETILLQDIFHFVQIGVDEAGRARGRFESTGVRPSFMHRLEALSITLPKDLFTEKVLLEV